MASKRLLLYATDAYKLSSLVVRQVLLKKPTSLDAFREKTRQLLLDQSRATTPTANVAAIKLLELDREWNLVQYHGVQEYAKRWWASRSFSFSLASKGIGGQSSKPSESNNRQNEESSNKNVARVAFMITSEQRHKLSTNLGYNPEDIRTFKPIEALLLLEHGVKRESDDFRVKLKELVEENERLMSMQHEEESQKQPNIAEVRDWDVTKENIQHTSYVSPEEAQQMHAKPDVALALISAEDDAKDGDAALGINVAEEEEEEAISSPMAKAVNDTATPASTDTNAEKESAGAAETNVQLSSTAYQPVNVTPDEADKLHMKPDVASAILTSHVQDGLREQQHLLDEEDSEDEGAGDEPCWYEVVERLPAGINDEGNQALQSTSSGEQIIALFPTKKEALECVRIKESFGRKGKASNDRDESRDRFLVRRRWNA